MLCSRAIERRCLMCESTRLLVIVDGRATYTSDEWAHVRPRFRRQGKTA